MLRGKAQVQCKLSTNEKPRSIAHKCSRPISYRTKIEGGVGGGPKSLFSDGAKLTNKPNAKFNYPPYFKFNIYPMSNSFIWNLMIKPIPNSMSYLLSNSMFNIIQNLIFKTKSISFLIKNIYYRQKTNKLIVSQS